MVCVDEFHHRDEQNAADLQAREYEEIVYPAPNDECSHNADCAEDQNENRGDINRSWLKR